MTKSVSGQSLPPLERTITSNIVKALRADGISFLRKTHGGAFQGGGLPDLLLIAPANGRLVGLEVKRPGTGRVTPLQMATIRQINDAGGFACVVRSVEDARVAVEWAGAGGRCVMREGKFEGELVL